MLMLAEDSCPVFLLATKYVNASRWETKLNPGETFWVTLEPDGCYFCLPALFVAELISLILCISISIMGCITWYFTHHQGISSSSCHHHETGFCLTSRRCFWPTTCRILNVIQLMSCIVREILMSFRNVTLRFSLDKLSDYLTCSQ